MQGGDVDNADMYVFFFQAEDGIRDYKVTGVQTCALPIAAEIASAKATGKPSVSRTTMAMKSVIPMMCVRISYSWQSDGTDTLQGRRHQARAWAGRAAPQRGCRPLGEGAQRLRGVIWTRLRRHPFRPIWRRSHQPRSRAQ